MNIKEKLRAAVTVPVVEYQLCGETVYLKELIEKERRELAKHAEDDFIYMLVWLALVDESKAKVFDSVEESKEFCESLPLSDIQGLIKAAIEHCGLESDPAKN